MVKFITITDELKKEAREKNERLIKAKLEEYKKEGKKLSVSDFAMVRLTNHLPNMRFVEVPYNYVKPMLMSHPFSYFDDRIDESFDMEYTSARETLHWALNSSVMGHSGGSFIRGFVIIEPFSFHAKDTGLMNLAAQDTYFNEDVFLSNQAIILIRKEQYDELIKDEKFVKWIEQYNVVVYEGEQHEAVSCVLADLGYVYGGINSHGFSDFDTIQEETSNDFCKLIKKSIDDIANELNVTSIKHAHSEIAKKDYIQANKNANATVDLFSETLSKITGLLDGSNVALILELKSVSIPPIEEYSIPLSSLPASASFRDDLFADDEETIIYKESKPIDYSSPSGYKTTEDECHYFVLKYDKGYLCLKIKDIINIIGLDAIKQATQITNGVITEEVMGYRAQKNEELAEDTRIIHP